MTWLELTLVGAALFGGLPHKHYTSSLSTRAEGAFESQKGVTVVRSSRVEQEAAADMNPDGPEAPRTCMSLMRRTPGLHRVLTRALPAATPWSQASADPAAV